MTTNYSDRSAAMARAETTVTMEPTNVWADDAATVVHVWGRNNVTGGYEDSYVAIGGAHDTATVETMWTVSGYNAATVAILWREGETCQEAVDRFERTTREVNPYTGTVLP